MSKSLPEQPEQPASDFLFGSLEIAQFLGLKHSKAKAAIQAGHVPTFRVGRRIAARRSELDAALRAQPPQRVA